MTAPADVRKLYNLLLRRDPESEAVVDRWAAASLDATFLGLINSDEFFVKVAQPLTTQSVVHSPYMGSTPFEALMAWVGETLPLAPKARQRLARNSSWDEFYLSLLLDAKGLDKLRPRLTDPNTRRALQLCRAELAADPRRLLVAGAIDYVNGHEIRGWCVNQADIRERMSVELFADNAFFGHCHCDAYRRDLQERFGGDGRHGFTLSLSPDQLRAFSVDRWVIAREAGTKRGLGRVLAPRCDATMAAAGPRSELAHLRRELANIRQTLERLEKGLPRLQNALAYPLSAYDEYFRAYYQPGELAPPPVATTGPLVSLVIPVVSVELALIHDAVASVQNQTYANWELLAVNAVPGHGEPSAFLARMSARDARIRVIEAGDHDLVSAANRGLAEASGAFVGVLQSGDRLAPDALRAMVAVGRDQPTDLIYADEDQFDPSGPDGPVHLAPQLKPQFDLDLLLAHNYVGDFFLVSGPALRAAGPLNGAFGRAAFHDLALRIVERADVGAIRRVPRVLRHRRAREDDAAAGQTEAVVACVNAYLTRNNLAAVAEGHDDPHGRPRPLATRLRWKLPDPAPTVSIIIPTRDHRELLEPCVASLAATTRDYPGPVEILIVDNDTQAPDAVAYLGALAKSGRARILKFGGAFNWSAINNFAVAEAKGEVLIFLNNDTVAISPGWCSELCSQALRPDVGAVGARLLYADGTIQHAGTALGPGSEITSHEGAHETVDDGGYLGRSHLQHGAAAVTGACLATRRAVFEAVGGFDELQFKVAFNDTDFCLKAREAGLKVIYTPFATLYHFESKSRGIVTPDAAGERVRREGDVFRRRWEGRMDDSFGNPHFAFGARLFSVLQPPPCVEAPGLDPAELREVSDV